MHAAGLTEVVARTWSERQQGERERRLERYREQLASGGLVVRQMTESERAYWNEHSAAADRKATPEQRERRDAAREKRRRRAEGNA
jgi:hypothetical protein